MVFEGIEHRVFYSEQLFKNNRVIGKYFSASLIALNFDIYVGGWQSVQY